jgi:S-DNA-T family DNA segregation ATPase FtsK/SpoIIIE
MVTGVSIKDEELRAAAADFGDNPYAIVVDDANQISIEAAKQGFGDAPTLLEESAQFTARGRTALILTADATPILSGFPSPSSRVVNSVLTSGACVLLTPANRSTSMAHHVGLEPDQFFTAPPGRGYLSALGPAPVLVQLATLS